MKKVIDLMWLRLAGVAVAAAMTASGGHATTLSVVAAQCADDAPTVILGGPTSALDCGAGARQHTVSIDNGTGDGAFYSLGLDAMGGDYGGILTLEFSAPFSGWATFFEVTYPSRHYEAAEIFVGRSTDFSDAVSMGFVDNGRAGRDDPQDTIEIIGAAWAFLFIRDASRAFYGATASSDGYDVDAISLAQAPNAALPSPSPVPLPAGVFLIGAALASLGLMRRRWA